MLLRYNGDDVTDYARSHCLRDKTLLFDDIGELDRRTRYAGGKIDPKHTFIGQNLGGIFGMKKVNYCACVFIGACDILFSIVIYPYSIRLLFH